MLATWTLILVLSFVRHVSSKPYRSNQILAITKYVMLSWATGPIVWAMPSHTRLTITWFPSMPTAASPPSTLSSTPSLSLMLWPTILSSSTAALAIVVLTLPTSTPDVYSSSPTVARSLSPCTCTPTRERSRMESGKPRN